jgi:hypothetical protein
MFENPQLSNFFWFSMSIAYAFFFSSLYTYSTIPEYTLELNNNAQINITMKLATVRLAIVATALLAYPIILFRFFKYAKYFTVALTAWAVAIYIDEIFVLTEVIKYPENGLISLIQSLRPIWIASLLWMSIELVFRPVSVD